MPNPTAASQAPTLRNKEEKKSSDLILNQINIRSTRHSKLSKSLRTSFFFFNKPKYTMKMQVLNNITHAKKRCKTKPKLINWAIPQRT